MLASARPSATGTVRSHELLIQISTFRSYANNKILQTFATAGLDDVVGLFNCPFSFPVYVGVELVLP